MSGTLRRIDEIKNFKKKTVIIRIDSDVKVENGTIRDDTRLKVCLKTLEYILSHNGNLLLLGHLRRPGGVVVPKLSLFPIADWFASYFHATFQAQNTQNFHSWKIGEHILLLENLRFYPGEEKNNKAFAKSLASLGDLYVNESFAGSHRDHASYSGIAQLLPAYAGFHLADEVRTLSSAMKSPKRPLVVIVGGAKIETKLPLIEKMHKIADYVLVGGKIADEVKMLIEVQHKKLPWQKSILFVAELKKNRRDITAKSIENFIQVIRTARTIVWNGPVGEIGARRENEEGSRRIAHAILEAKNFNIVGGGDTIAFLNELKILGEFDFVSIGGGAMLKFLSGEKLPGIIPLIR